MQVAGHDIISNQSDAFQALGYCPQHDALWRNITVREHMEAYAAIRGIVPSHIPRYNYSSATVRNHLTYYICIFFAVELLICFSADYGSSRTPTNMRKTARAALGESWATRCRCLVDRQLSWWMNLVPGWIRKANASSGIPYQLHSK